MKYKYLISQKIHYTGTLNLNRKKLPLRTQNKQVQPSCGQILKYCKADEIQCVTVRDKKAQKLCLVVSTMVTMGTVTVTRRHGKKVEMPTIFNAYFLALHLIKHTYRLKLCRLQQLNKVPTYKFCLYWLKWQAASTSQGLLYEVPHLTRPSLFRLWWDWRVNLIYRAIIQTFWWIWASICLCLSQAHNLGF